MGSEVSRSVHSYEVGIQRDGEGRESSPVPLLREMFSAFCLPRHFEGEG